MNGSSTLGYPFTARKRGLVGTAADAAGAAALLPWTLLLRWLSWCAGLLLRVLTALGAPPLGYLPQSKLQELDSIVNHMHSREDLYRRAIRELQEEVDAKERRTKAATRKLAATREEIAALNDRLAAQQERYIAGGAAAGPAAPSVDGGASDAAAPAPPPAPLSRLALHATVAAAAAGLWWFCQEDHPAVHWKLVFSFSGPLIWYYLSWATSRRAGPTPVPLMCGAWFLLGYVTAHGMGADHSLHELP